MIAIIIVTTRPRSAAKTPVARLISPWPQGFAPAALTKYAASTARKRSLFSDKPSGH